MLRWLLLIVLVVGSITCFAFANTQAVSKPPVSPEQPAPPPVVQNVLPEHKHTADCEKTSAEPVQLICILDRSGSMSSLAGDTIGGYNSFLAKQRNEPGKAEVTTVLFDDQYEKFAEGVDLQQATDLTSKEYYARGTTALLDAVGRTIMDTLGRMEKDGVCPAKRRVLIMIMTDGKENASKEYNKATVKAMIEKTTNDYKWNYIFIGANIDSVAEAGSIGIHARHARNYSPDSKGVAETFSQMDEAARGVREKGTVD